MKKILFIIIAIIVSVQVTNAQNVQEKDTFNIVNWLKNNNDLYVPYESNIFKSEPVVEMIDDYHFKAYDYKSADKNNDYAIKYTGTDKKENVYWDLDFELDFSFFKISERDSILAFTLYRLLDSTNKVFIQYHFIDSYIHNEKRYYIYNKELRRKYPNGEIAILKYNNLAENQIDEEFYYTTEPFTTVRVEYEHNCCNKPPSRLRYTFFTDYRNLLQKDELDFFLKNELISIIK